MPGVHNALPIIRIVITVKMDITSIILEIVKVQHQLKNLIGHKFLLLDQILILFTHILNNFKFIITFLI